MRFGATKQEITAAVVADRLKAFKEARLSGGLYGTKPVNVKRAYSSDGVGSMDADLQEAVEGLGAIFKRATARREDRAARTGRNGKGKHDASSRRNAKGSELSESELMREAGVVSPQRYDDGEVFASGNNLSAPGFWRRLGVETKLGFGVAHLGLLTLAVGNFPVVRAQTAFEIQELYISANGQGASAAATISIQASLIALLAVATFKVGDDNMITGGQYVNASAFAGPEELAGFVATTNADVNLSMYNGAAFTIPTLCSLGGERVIPYVAQK